MSSTVWPVWPVWRIPAAWQRIDLASDLHLDNTRPRTLGAWLAQVHDSAAHADALIILGDLFEAWIGDDCLDDPQDTTGAQVADALHQASARIPVAIMHGNRDFLLGAAFARLSGACLIHDPTVLELGAHDRLLLTHGDALCVADTAYQAFRRQVRDPAWQAQVLALPIEQRRALAARLRQDSQTQAGAGSPMLADVDQATAMAWLRQVDARCLVHGHTHRPGDESWPDGLARVVLSDWEVDQVEDKVPARAELLSLQRGPQGWKVLRQDRRPAVPAS